MLQDLPPEYVRHLGDSESFRFRCHQGVGCFNECCRQLELVLTPYDVLRLKRGLGLASHEFLDRYALVEQTEDAAWPRVYLGMVDDGRDSCPFVSPAGCRVYAHRPGACRMYPLGRGLCRQAGGGPVDLYVLLREPHCRGFAEPVAPRSIGEWLGDQELLDYNVVNDQMMPILHPEWFNRGWRPDEGQCDKFLLALYDLDEFKKLVMAADSDSSLAVADRERNRLAADELALLRFACRWLHAEFFGRPGALRGCSGASTGIRKEEN
jgi:uncharacterized protein